MSRPEWDTTAGLRFEEASGELTGPTGTVRLAPQPAALLTLLTSRVGEVVSRDEVRDHLWPDGKVEFEQGIAFAVREIRKAIAEAGGDPTMLETIPKRGFRLRCEDGAPDVRAAGARSLTRTALWALVGIVVVGGLITITAVRGRSSTPPVIVVFAHGVVSDEPRDARLGEALGFRLTTAMTGELAGAVGVIGPTGTASLEGPGDTDAIRTEVGACLVLSGEIEPLEGDYAAVFTQVVRTSDRVHVWATRDTVRRGELGGSVVDEIVDGVRRSLGGC